MTRISNTTSPNGTSWEEFTDGADYYPGQAIAALDTSPNGFRVTFGLRERVAPFNSLRFACSYAHPSRSYKTRKGAERAIARYLREESRAA